jgi:hypothetical protein
MIFHFHIWETLPISFELKKRGVIARKKCIKCGRTFIKKPWSSIWMETHKANDTSALDEQKSLKDLIHND